MGEVWRAIKFNYSTFCLQKAARTSVLGSGIVLAQRQLLGPWLPENRLRLIQKCLNPSAAAQELGWSCGPETQCGVCC